MADLSSFNDFLDEANDLDGFDTPLMPSTKYPQGKKYHVPSPDALTGLRLAALADLTVKASRGGELNELDAQRLRLDDAEERDFVQQVLTPEVVEEMLQDGVKWTHLKRIATFGFTYFAIGEDAAMKAAEAGLFSGKALVPVPANREERRATAKPKKAARTGGSTASKPHQSARAHQGAE